MNKFYLKNNKACSVKLQQSRGFTIIETMISISVFLVVVMIGVDSLLNASLLHQKSRDQRSVMDNLSFIMEDMSRNVRTGYNFRCISAVFQVSDATGAIGNTPQNCASGGALVFENALGTPYDGAANQHTEDQWVYKIESSNGTDFNIYKSVDGAVTFTKLNLDEIKLDSTSGFTVTGSTLLDNQQPLISMRLIGKIVTRGKETPFSLQTAVSQRTSE